VFNLQPGMGLGFTGSKEIALGLGVRGYIKKEILRLVSYIRRTLSLESVL